MGLAFFFPLSQRFRFRDLLAFTEALSLSLHPNDDRDRICVSQTRGRASLRDGFPMALLLLCEAASTSSGSTSWRALASNIGEERGWGKKGNTENQRSTLVRRLADRRRMPSVGEWERVVCFLFWRGGAEAVDRAFTFRRQVERTARSIDPLPTYSPWEKRERG